MLLVWWPHRRTDGRKGDDRGEQVDGPEWIASAMMLTAPVIIPTVSFSKIRIVFETIESPAALVRASEPACRALVSCSSEIEEPARPSFDSHLAPAPRATFAGSIEQRRRREAPGALAGWCRGLHTSVAGLARSGERRTPPPDPIVTPATMPLCCRPTEPRSAPPTEPRRAGPDRRGVRHSPFSQITSSWARVEDRASTSRP